MLHEETNVKYKEIIRFCDYWTMQFLNSNHAEELNEEQRWFFPCIVLNFVESMHVYFGLTPKEWSKEYLEKWYFSILPNKVHGSKSFYDAIEPVLSKFFSFIHENGIMINDLSLKMGLFLLKKKLNKTIDQPII
ncbi:MAG: hypothetical protein EU539_04830 [Promethearchaeota archaeon]|nr:MAG: hypothetical protein EU539_04830 [Candidatus Lokiarchaeota archaeon]